MLQSKLDWQEQAACIKKPTVWFFPDTDDTRPDVYVYGKAVCQGCPVRATCLDYAMKCEMDSRWRFGLWGGLTPHERWIHDPAWRDRRGW